jgi:hypothetical protein
MSHAENDHGNAGAVLETVVGNPPSMPPGGRTGRRSRSPSTKSGWMGDSSPEEGARSRQACSRPHCRSYVCRAHLKVQGSTVLCSAARSSLKRLYATRRPALSSCFRSVKDGDARTESPSHLLQPPRLPVLRSHAAHRLQRMSRVRWFQACKAPGLEAKISASGLRWRGRSR